MPGEVVAELIDRIMLARHGGVDPGVDLLVELLEESSFEGQVFLETRHRRAGGD